MVGKSGVVRQVLVPGKLHFGQVHFQFGRIVQFARSLIFAFSQQHNLVVSSLNRRPSSSDANSRRYALISLFINSKQYLLCDLGCGGRGGGMVVAVVVVVLVVLVVLVSPGLG